MLEEVHKREPELEEHVVRGQNACPTFFLIKVNPTGSANGRQKAVNEIKVV